MGCRPGGCGSARPLRCLMRCRPLAVRVPGPDCTPTRDPAPQPVILLSLLDVARGLEHLHRWGGAGLHAAAWLPAAGRQPARRRPWLAARAARCPRSHPHSSRRLPSPRLPCRASSFNIVHGDLKAQNVLLKSTAADRRGFVCKVRWQRLARALHEEVVAMISWPCCCRQGADRRGFVCRAGVRAVGSLHPASRCARARQLHVRFAALPAGSIRTRAPVA